MAGPLASAKSLSQVGEPAEVTQAAVPADNPQNPEKIALSEELFSTDVYRLMAPLPRARAMTRARAFTDGRSVSVGAKGFQGQHNAPTILNSLYNVEQFWDGSAKTLEDQAFLPIINPCEMGQPNLDAAVAEIAKFPEYQQAFRKVFGRPPNGTDLACAIASYERTQFSFDLPFDHFTAGDENAISDFAKRGSSTAKPVAIGAMPCRKKARFYLLDGQGFSQHRYWDHSPQCRRRGVQGGTADRFRQPDRRGSRCHSVRHVRTWPFLVTKPADIASFKTLGLRNALVTVPHFHDGSQATLWDVLDHYSKGDGVQDPWLDQDIEPLALSEAEIDDVVAFLASLTSLRYKEQGTRELERQRALSRTDRPQRDTPRAFGPKPVEPKPSRNCAALPAATNSK